MAWVITLKEFFERIVRFDLDMLTSCRFGSQYVSRRRIYWIFIQWVNCWLFWSKEVLPVGCIVNDYWCFNEVSASDLIMNKILLYCCIPDSMCLWFVKYYCWYLKGHTVTVSWCNRPVLWLRFTNKIQLRHGFLLIWYFGH